MWFKFNNYFKSISFKIRQMILEHSWNRIQINLIDFSWVGHIEKSTLATGVFSTIFAFLNMDPQHTTVLRLINTNSRSILDNDGSRSFVANIYNNKIIIIIRINK